MFDLKDLQAAKKKMAEKRSGNSDEAYEEGLKILESYKQSPSITKLDQAGKKFIESLDFNKDHVPSLIYLSYVFYALSNEEMALKYINMVFALESDLPDEIVKYKDAVIKRVGAKSNV